MMTYTTVQALGQARLADLPTKPAAARWPATLAGPATPGGNTPHIARPHCWPPFTQARVPQRKTTVGTPGRVMRDG
jgi:hypothetical protein